MDRRNFLNHICDFICIRNDDFLRLFASQIRKFLQHFLCGSKIERSLIICIGKSVSGHNNSSVNLVLRIHKMYVTGGDNRLFKLLSKLYNISVYLL